MDKVVERWVTTSKPLESRGLWKRFVQERNQILPQAKPSKSISDKYQDYLKAESYLEPKSQMFVRDEMGFDEGGLATPKRGLVDGPGSYSQKSQKPLSVKEMKEIEKTLPDGISIFTDVNKSGKRRVTLIGQVGKKNKLLFQKSKTNPTKDQINDLIKEHAAARKKYYPNELSDADFKKLRFDKKYINMSDTEFADALNKLGKTTRHHGKSFTRDTVIKLQKNLGITHEVGRQTGQKVGHTTQKLLTPNQQKKIIDSFPEIKKWNFRSAKDPGAPLYGVGPSQVGTDKYDLIRKVSRNDLAWPVGRTLEDKLWQNAYRSAIAGKGENRFRILHPETNKIMSRSEIVEHNWVRDHKKAKFLDTKTNKRFTYNTFEKWMNNHAVPGKIDPNRYNNAKAKYKLSTDLKNVKIIQGGKEVTFGNVLANKFRQGKERFFSGLHNHHPFNIADNFWDTEVVFFKDNKGIRNFEPNARAALREAANLPKNQQTKFLKEFSNKFKKMGPIRITEGGLTLGSYDPKKMITNVARQAGVSSKELKTLLEDLCPNKAQGGRIGMKVAGTPGVACGANRFKQVFKNPAKGTQAERQLVGQIVKRGGTTAGRKALYVLGPAGVGIDALIEGAIWGDEVLKGSSGAQAYKNHWLSYLDPTSYTGGLKVSGDRYNETEIAKKYKGDTAKFFNLRHAIEDKYRLENKLKINEESDAEGYGITLTPNQQNRLKEANTIIENAGGEETVYSLIKEDSPLYDAARISSEKFEEVGPGKDWDRKMLAKGPLAQKIRDEKRKKEMDLYPTYDMFITPSEYKAMDLEQQREAKNVIPQASLTERAGLKKSYAPSGTLPTDDLSQIYWKDTGMSLLDEYNLGKKWNYLINQRGMTGTQDRFAGGGIAGVRRPHAIPPKSGPMPQGGGLSSMFNRVRKW